MPHVERFRAAVPPGGTQNILKKYFLKDFDFNVLTPQTPNHDPPAPPPTAPNPPKMPKRRGYPNNFKKKLKKIKKILAFLWEKYYFM